MTAPCTRPPAGWWCSLEAGHDGPCPTRFRIRQAPRRNLLCILFDHRFRWRDVDPEYLGPWEKIAWLTCTRCGTDSIGPDGRLVWWTEPRPSRPMHFERDAWHGGYNPGA